MKHFTSIDDVHDLPELLREVAVCKAEKNSFRSIAKGKSITLLFLSPSLRTRLSTQRAAQLLGMDVMVLNVGQEGWNLEFEDGTVMDGDRPEHIREAAAVIGSYSDIIGIRSFARLDNRESDYEERVISQFKAHAGVPIISLESETLHPLQSLTDMFSIEEWKNTERPKVVLTWVPHIKALPQAVSNSFLEWARMMNYEVVLTHPEGYALDERFTRGVSFTHQQEDALQGADFVYAKNWSSYQHYGQVRSQDTSWMISGKKMSLTRNARFMHCLPVRRNLVVADEVLNSPASIVIPQAENRLYSAMAVIKKLMQNE